MSAADNNDIRQALDNAMAARPYTHLQDVDAGITAVVTVEEDTRFLQTTLHALLTQHVLPGTVVIADATGRTKQSVRTSFEVIHSTAEPVMHVPEAKTVTIEVVGFKGARSFGEAVSKALVRVNLNPSTRAIWLLHDDSKPADDSCLEALLEAWRKTPGASVLGCKQLDWENKQLHNVGMYASGHDVHSLVVDGEPDQEQYDGRQDVFAVSMAGALVSFQQFNRLRGFDSWFTTYGESIDFCRRVCLSGGRVVVVPEAAVAHRRARFEGARTRGGEALDADHAADPAMTVLRAAQRYRYTDMPMSSWLLAWLWRWLRGFGAALWNLFNKQPYRAWVELCLPWLALFDIPGALRARRRVTRQSTVAMSSLQVLTADRQQVERYHDRRRALLDQRDTVLLGPLEKSHLRTQSIRRWTMALAMAVVSMVTVIVAYWPVFRSVFAQGSLSSSTLLASAASLHQLAQSATTPWVFGVDTGVPAPPEPFLLVLLVASLGTLGHVAVAMTVMLFSAAPLAALSFWALAGIFTRSNAVRVVCGLLWASLGMMFGWYAHGNLPMLTVMVFLPAAFAFVFRAVGMYHTEEPLRPRPSVQAAALSSLCFIPVVAGEPQLLLALIICFLMFLLFVRRHRLMLLLIPVPAAFAVAPTLLNAIRYADEGAWRQVFGDIMVPQSEDGSPAALSLLQSVQRSLGWNPLSLELLDVLMSAVLAVTLLLAVAALVLPFALRASRLMWMVIVCGGALAMVSCRVAVGVDENGVAAGSAGPGLLLMMMGVISCVCLVAGGAVKHFNPLHRSNASAPAGGTVDAHRAIVVARSLLVLVLAGCVAVQCWYGMSRFNESDLRFSGRSLPMVAVDYLAQNPDRRVLTLDAQTRNIVDYTVMRTARGELVDSSSAQRVRELEGSSNQPLAEVCARLLADSDSEAVTQIANMGFGGIYVVAGEDDSDTAPYDQLKANIAATNGTQLLVSNEDGSYFRITAKTDATVDTAWQQRTQHSVWRHAWLVCLSVVMVVYLLVALPRRRRYALEES